MFARSHELIRGLLWASILILAVTSCNKSVSAAISSSEKSDEYTDERKVILKAARSEIGKYYKYAGIGPDRWDCSGLTCAAYSKVEVSLPRTARAMAKLDKEGIKKEEAKPGDLIFFEKGGRVFHVSIITEFKEGTLWVVHSTTSRGVVEEDILASPYWKEKIHKVISLETILENK